jgi:hypothetical protein
MDEPNQQVSFAQRGRLSLLAREHQPRDQLRRLLVLLVQSRDGVRVGAKH